MITYDHVHEGNNQFVCEASDLYDACPEFQKGWPAKVDTNIGNKQPFLRVAKKVDADGDIMYVMYQQALGCVFLKVFND